MASNTSSVSTSNSLPGTSRMGRRPSWLGFPNSTRTACSFSTRPLEPLNRLVLTLQSRKPPSSWEEEVLRIIGQ